MKQIIISLLLLAYQSLSAQHILNHEANAPHVGDRLKPLYVELSKASFDEEQHLWDFSHMQSLEKNSRQRYITLGDSTGRRTACIEDGLRTYYKIKGDSLLITGRENSLTKIAYDEPELFLRFPMQLGDSVAGFFHGRGTYCNRVALCNYGYYHTKVMEQGSLILPEGDTLRHVLLVQTERITGERCYPDFYHDSLSVYPTDSVLPRLLADSVLTTAHVERWYAPGYRYPILERRLEYIEDCAEESQEKLSDITLYNAPYRQAELDDEYNAAVREMLANNPEGIDTNTSGNDDSNNNTDATSAKNVSVSVSGKTISVSFDLTSDTTVRALICNVLGVVFKQESQTGHAGEHYQMNVYCGGLSTGNYVLHLQVNGKTVFSNPCNL